MLRLSDSARFGLEYADTSPFGSQISTRIDRLVRRCLHGATELRGSQGLSAVVARSRELLTAAMNGGPSSLGALYQSPSRLREECLYPPWQDVYPSAVVVQARPGEKWSRLRLEPSTIPELGSWFAEWSTNANRPRCAAAARLWADLREIGGLVSEAPRPQVPGEVLFVGHACVRIGPPGSEALFDPFLLPPAASYPHHYQPFTASELRPAAVFVTHSHPDHYDIGSLLRFSNHLPIFVPHVARESILAVDMVGRLRQLGFSNVKSVRPWETVAVGQTTVTALPFTGEQPTASDWLHPEVRNEGNLYLVESLGRRYALCADAGRDHSGDVREIAAAARERYGPIDVLFGGYRSWAVYPVTYVFQSISRYLLLVPQERWTVRQQIMNDSNELLDTAESWGAKMVVPYADGGAPWYWQLGLGPDLSAAGCDGLNPHIDPRPEVVLECARRRSSGAGQFIASPVKVCLLHPGECLQTASPDLVAEPAGARHWPYGRWEDA